MSRHAHEGSARRAEPGAPRPGRRIVRIVLPIVAALVLVVSIDLGSTLLRPTQESPLAVTAEWARSRGLGDAVSWLERAAYEANPPQEGGQPTAGVPRDAKPLDAPPTGAAADQSCAGQRLTPSSSQPLPDEGAWQPIETVGGRPAILAAFLRPDDRHTRFLAGITCIDQRLVSFTLHPGTDVPGDTGWSQAPSLSKRQLSRLLATFNSGFRMEDSRGGFWMDGKTAGRLVDGRAAMVFYQDGRLDIRSWEGGTPASDITAVRQNLTLLIDGGRITDAVRQADGGAFGKTLGDTTYVWRSGIGIRPDGSIVTVHGNALSVKTLAQLLANAGAERAMELDINRDWTSYIYYEHSADGIVPRKLTSDQVRPAGRYLRTSARDFVAVESR